MNNRLFIGVGSAIAVAVIVVAILIAGTQTTAQQPGAPAVGGAAGNSGGNTLILVVDRGAILRNSAAGKDMLKQIDDLGKQLEAKYADEEKKLRADIQQFQEQQAVLSPEARAKKEADLRRRQEDLQKKVQDDQAAVQNGINNARAEVEKAVGPILNSLFQERKATIMLDRAAIVLGANDTDITAQTIQRLDQVLPSVKVTPAAPPPGTTPDGQQPGQGNQ